MEEEKEKELNLSKVLESRDPHLAGGPHELCDICMVNIWDFPRKQMLSPSNFHLFSFPVLNLGAIWSLLPEDGDLASNQLLQSISDSDEYLFVVDFVQTCQEKAEFNGMLRKNLSGLSLWNIPIFFLHKAKLLVIIGGVSYSDLPHLPSHFCWLHME